MNIYVVVLFLFIIVLIAFGALAAKQNKGTVQDYFVAGRSMSKWVVAGTYGASFLSAGSFLGTLGYNYTSGWAAGWQLVGTLTCMVCLGVFFARKFWRFGYHNNACSMPDLIGMRYPSKFSRGFYAFMILIIYTVGMASMFMGINSVLGFVSDLPYMACIIIGAVAVFIYTISGGSRAVAWTDTVCMVLMIFAMVATLTAVIAKGGGFANIVTQYGQSKTPEGMTWQEGDALVSGTNGYLTVVMSISWFLVWATGNLCQPHQITRIYLAKNEKTAIQAIALVMIPFAVIYFAGLTIASYGRVTIPAIERTDSIFPAVVLDIFPSFLAAIILIGIIASILSTASTMLIIASQCSSYDIYAKLINPKATDKQILTISRTTMVVCTVLSIAIAYGAQTISGLIFLWSSAFAMMGAGILPSLIGAFYWKRANTPANIASMVVGFASTAAMYLWPSLRPAWAPHPILPGLILSFIVFIVVALATKKPDDEVIEKFFGKDLQDPVV